MSSAETVVVGDYYIDKGFLQMVYDEAKEDILRENRIAARQIQRRRNAKRTEETERRTYFANQKLLGGIWCALVLVLTLLIGDLTGLILLVPGIAVIRTDKMVIVNRYWHTHGGAEQWK